jgi:hypothetical protein
MSLHRTCVSIFPPQLKALSYFLDKAEESAAARKFDVAVLLQSRLAPDMHPVVRQVQMSADHAKFTFARLGGVEAPVNPDTDATVADLKARIARTIAFLESVPASAIDGATEKQISFKVGPTMELNFSGADYLARWALPNFYFHVTTAYAILRHNGVELGKRDFMTGGQ